MKSHARVVVIGGGVVGCSVLYHLTTMGWKDVVLVERSQLTSGSTWHAAGGMHTLNGDPNVAKLQQYTISLYQEIERISGQSCGVHLTGGIMLAGTPERMEFLKGAHATGRYLGMETEIVGVEEAKALFPLLDERYFLGALYDPMEGHVDPSGVTHAYAKAARIQGAEVSLETRVVDLQARTDGGWEVITDKGTIIAEQVVNAGGLWAREVGRMVGIELPVLAMEHMYILTEDMPEVAEIVARTGKQMMHAIDFEGEIYMRQERGGMLMGTYEKACVPWSERDTPWDFGHELLAPDIDRIAPSLEVGFRHFPAFETAGIRQIINGPFTFSPDGNPLVGPVRGVPNYWVACAVMAGFSQGGGVGLALANWMIDGDPGFDIWGMDVARFGGWTTPAYTNAKVRENYAHRFRVPFPNEELPAGRPLRTTPIYSRLKDRNAVFGSAYGLEHALWFAPQGAEPVEKVTFRRSNAFATVGEECRAVRTGVGLLEISSFAKYAVTGPGAEEWLGRVLANRPPREGRIALSPMLNERGMLIGDFTVARTGADRFLVFGSGLAEDYHMRWFEAHRPASGVGIAALGIDLTGLAIAGPKSRALLEGVTDEDVGGEGFPFLDFREMVVGGIPAQIGRISFTGELGYEIWVAPEHLAALFDLLTEAGAAFGLRLFGGRALNSLRLEKGFGSWATEYRPIYNAFEAGLGRFIDRSNRDFIGRDAVLRQREKIPERRLVAMVVDADDADAWGNEPIWRGEQVVGWVTSGGYGHVVGKSIALGYVPTGMLEDGDGAGFAVEILGERRPATVCPEPLVDPTGARLRG
ncbi:MAG: FAD-dependent oxidoreductase [Alphaproteobacteria bacterium]